MFNLVSEIENIKQKSKESYNKHENAIVDNFRHNHSLWSCKCEVIKMACRTFLHKAFYHSVYGGEK